MAPAHPRLLFFVLAVVFLDAAGFGLVLPVMPQLIATLTGTKLGVAASYGGWIGFEYAVALFVFAPLLGALSDRFGRRPVLLLALIGLAANYVLMAFASTIAWIFVGRFLSGVGGATFSVASAFAADITPPEKRAQKFGLIGAAFGAGFITGPVIGGLLGQHDLRLPFIAAAVVALLNLAYGALFVPETLAPETQHVHMARHEPVQSVRGRMAAPVAVAAARGRVRLPARDADESDDLSVLRHAQAGLDGGATSASLGGRRRRADHRARLLDEAHGAPDRRGRTVYVGLSFGAIGYAGFAFARTSLGDYVWLAVSALNFLTYPALQAIMSARVGPDGQGKLQGIVASVVGLSAIVVPPVMTGLFRHYSADGAAVWFPGAPFVAAAAIVLVGIGVFTAAMARRPQPLVPAPAPT